MGGTAAPQHHLGSIRQLRLWAQFNRQINLALLEKSSLTWEGLCLRVSLLMQVLSHKLRSFIYRQLNISICVIRQGLVLDILMNRYFLLLLSGPQPLNGDKVMGWILDKTVVFPKTSV